MEQSVHNTSEIIHSLYHQHVDELLRFCRSKVRDREEAMDTVHDTFVNLWRHIEQGKPLHHPRGLIYQIARNLIIDKYRMIRPTQSLDEFSDGIVDTEATSTLDITELNHVLRCVDSLPQKYREVIMYRYVDGMPVQEIATLLNETPNAISIRIHRGIEQLRTVLNDTI